MRGAWIIVLIACGLVSCAHTAVLKPESPDTAVPGKKAAAVTQAGPVTVEVDGDAWSEPDQIKKFVTPLLVTIENNSDHRVRLRYEDFVIVGQDGRTYAAISPFDVRGTIQVPVAAHPYFGGLGMAPIYSPFYPDIAFSDPFYFQPGYYDSYYRYWSRESLPTPEMVARALHEGVLEARSKITGFLYFSKIDPKSKLVAFRANFVDAQTQEVLAQTSLQFLVDRAAIASY